MLQNLGMFAVLFFQLFKQVLQRGVQEILFHFAQSQPQPFLQFNHLAQRIVEKILQLAARYLELLPFALIEFTVFLLRQRLPFAGRDQYQSTHGTLQQKTFGIDFRFKILNKLLVSFLRLLGDGIFGLFIFLAFKKLRNGLRQVADQGIHIIPESLAKPRRQPDTAGLVATYEIVDIAPVVRDRLRFGTLLQHPLDGRGTSGSRLAENKNIETVGINTQSELNGGQGPVLADRLLRAADFAGAGELKLGGIAFPEKFLR